MEKKENYLSDRQVSLILKRASELQKKESRSLQEPGLTPSDLEKIAMEAGIDQRYIRKAISEMEEGSLKGNKSLRERFLGNNPRIILKEEIPIEIPVTLYENLIPVLQKTAHISGNHSLIGNTFTWNVDNYQTGQFIHVMITGKNGKTNIEIESNLSQVAGGLFGGIMGGLGGGAGISLGVSIGIAATGSLLFTILFPIGAIGVSYFLARVIFKAISTSHQKKMNKIMKAIVKEIEST